MRCFTNFAGALLCLASLPMLGVAQQPEPTPPEETVRIPTQEVHLTVHAQGAFPGFAPKLRPEDIGVFEDGVAQSITSMRSTPASVLLLLDTGAALTFAKSRDMIALTARLVIDSLPETTVCSVFQYSDRTDVISAWTDKREEIAADIGPAIKSGRRSLLASAVELAVKSFASQPIGNRHLILITDGLNGSSAMDISAPVFADLAAANIAVHVVSYTAIEQNGAEEAGKTVRINTRPSRPRVPKEIFDEMVRGLPISVEAKEFLKTMNEATQIVIIDLDGERKKMLRTRRGEWAKAEINLRELANETGGSVFTPTDALGLATAAAEVARSIGSHFDVTYTPLRPIIESESRTVRTISVVSRIEAIKVRTRKKLMTGK